ncbi:FMN-binding negative transcriptional regulator [Streptomyces montanisoli]|uniref:FMN-binding negative transcriptional regulator n=1 Tax=Streptomyces montanisoli TaxID=2798581 RepID=A0A940M8H0_9ACTN|nr:FMN-binding negative transcriptional regulator [Streptomyces montanisoli]MBP0458189.1 FMN-binding negative transcriptional regulator [Streptomyces montanisoli]
MLIHPWDEPPEDRVWREWLAEHDFGELAVNGAAGEPPFVQPLHFAYDPAVGAHGEVVTHLARPNPLWSAVQSRPTVLLSVVDDYVFVPGPWQAPDGTPPEHGVPTSFYTAIQLTCEARVVDDAEEKAALLNRQVTHFQGEGVSVPVRAGEPPFGRMLTGIRVLHLEVTAVRAKFKYAAHKPEDVKERTAAGLRARGAAHDAEALAHHTRHRARLDARS